jgi:hypothetical protein
MVAWGGWRPGWAATSREWGDGRAGGAVGGGGAGEEAAAQGENKERWRLERREEREKG